jgi:hypothetical protein
VTEIQKIQSHVNGAQSRRTGGNSALHILIELVDNRLCLNGGFNVKATHTYSLLVYIPDDRSGSAFLLLEKDIESSIAQSKKKDKEKMIIFLH